MDRGDILAKLQSTSTAETCTLSITDAVVQTKSDPSLFKLISSANNLEQRLELDKVPESTKQAIINKFLSTATVVAAAPTTTLSSSTALASCTSVSSSQTMPSSLLQNNDIDIETGKIDLSTQYDAQTTTKNKRKNFKPRNSCAADNNSNTEPSLTDQILLNLMMQNKMKMFQFEFAQNPYKRIMDDAKSDASNHRSIENEQKTKVASAQGICKQNENFCCFEYF